MASSLTKLNKRSTHDKLASVQLPEKDSLQEANMKLKAALQQERNSLRQLRREMGVQLKHAQEEEQRRSALVVKDLKSKCHFEKLRELDLQKEHLNKRFAGEYMKLSKMKEAEHKRLHNEVTKLRGELQHSTASLLATSGLSGMARDTFEHERAKLSKENKELQASKKNLEAEVTSLREQEKKSCYEVKKLTEDHSAESARMRKETDIEIRKLLDELKVKDRQLAQAQQGGGTAGGGEGKRATEDTMSTAELEPPGAANWTPKISELSSKLKVTEDKSKTLEDEKQRLQVRLKEVERKQRPLLEKNKKFLAKNMELSSLNRSLEDKMKDLVQENEKLKSDVLRHQRSVSRRQSVETLRDLTPEDLRRELRDHQRKQVESDKTIAALKLACAEKDRRIELILHRKRKQRASKAQNKVSCNKSRSKPAVEQAAGIKETYFGYEEADSSSVADDSEMSLSIGSSSDMLDDEEVFEEFTREEFEANYQRLVKEHLELEKSFSLLSASKQVAGGGGPETQREAKLRSQLQSDLSDAQAKIKDLETLIKDQGKDTGWIEEKGKLTKTIRLLKEKVLRQESAEHTYECQLEEIQEQNEVLEFRTLELEEQCEKLSEELGETVTFTGSGNLTDTGLLQMYTEEKGSIEVSLADLKENIMQLKEEHGPRLSVEEKVCLVQYISVVQTSSSKLREFVVTVDALKARIKQLEEEKAQILSHDQGIEAGLVIEYEETRNKLIEQELKIHQLTSDLESLTQAEAIHAYKESHFEKLESRYHDEITELKRRLSSASEGRDYENEVFLDKLSQLRNAEKKLCELGQENEGLKSQIGELQRECVELHEQLTLQQDTLSLTESDKDTVTHTGPYLQEKMTEKSEVSIMEAEKEAENQNSKDSNQTSQTETNILTECVSSLERSLSHLKNVNDELVSENTELHTLAENLKSAEDKLKEDNAQLRHVLQDLSDTSRQVEDELEAKQNESEALKNDLHGRNEDILTLHNELEDKENELKRIQDKHQKVEFAQQRSVTSLQKQLNKLKQENKGYKEEVHDLKTASDGHNHEGSCVSVTDRTNSTGTQTDSLDDYCGHVTKKQVLCCDMDTQTTADIERITGECSKLRELEAEIAVLMKIITEKDNKSKTGVESREQIQEEEYKAEISAMRQEIDEKEGLILESMDTVSMLQEKLKDYESFKVASEEYLKEVETLQGIVGELEQQNTELKRKLKEQEEDIINLYDEFEEKVKTVERYENSSKPEDKSDGFVSSNDMDNDVQDLMDKKDRQIEELQQQVINLEHSDQEAAQKILELLETKGRLSSRLRQLEAEGAGDNGESEELRFQVDQLTQGKHRLQEKLHELQDLLDEEISNSATLERQVSSLESSNQTLEKQVITFKVQSTDISSSPPSTEGHKIIVRTTRSSHNNVTMETENNNKPISTKDDLDCSSQSEDKSFNEAVSRNQGRLEVSHDKDHIMIDEAEEDKSFNEAVLRNRVAELEHQLEMTGEEMKLAQSELLTLEEDSSKRIMSLEEQIQSLEDNRGRLSETVSDLGEIEKDLRKKVEIYDSAALSHSGSKGTEASELMDREEYDEKIKKLSNSEQNYKDRLEQMSLNETLLRERLSEVEEKLQKQESEMKSARLSKLSSTDSVFMPSVEVVSSQPKENDIEFTVCEAQCALNIKNNEETKEQRDIDTSGAVIVLHDSESDPPETGSTGDLHERVQQLEAAKIQLENEFEILQRENSELVEQVQELVSKNETEKGQLQEQLEVFITAEGKLMEQVGYLEEENGKQREEIEKLSEKIADSQGGSEELEVKLSHMRKREKGLLQVIDTLKDKIEQSDSQQADSDRQELMQLREKVDLLLDSEEKLMDKLQEKDEVELSLRASLENYKAALNQSEKDREETIAVTENMKRAIEAFEENEDKYVKERQETEENHKKQVEEYEEILNVYELEKVKRNEVEENLRKNMEDCKKSIGQYELEKVGMSEKLKRLEILEEMQEGNNKLQQIANRRIAELEASEEDLSMKVKHLEAALQDEGKEDLKLDEEEVGHQRLRHLQRELAELENVVEDYESQIKEGNKEQEDLRARLNQAEQTEESLDEKVKQLQGNNEELLAAVQGMQEQVVVMQGESLQQRALVNGQYKGKSDGPHEGQENNDKEVVSEEPLRTSHTDLQYVVPEIVTPVSSQVTLRSLMPSSHPNEDGGGAGGDHINPYSKSPSPIDVATLDKMSQEEVLTKLQQLQQMDGFHRIKIEEMRENLEQFRKAVEVIAVSMEADSESPVLKMKPKLRDGDFEGRVNEMVRSEVALKLRVLELEKREATLSKRLLDAEEALRLQQTEFNTELEDLEQSVNTARKSEARLRARLEYGSPDGDESEAVLRIQELEERVIDLESTENQLRRQVEDLRARESALRCQLDDAGGVVSFSGSVGPLTSSLRRAEDKDKYWDLVEQVRGLEASEKQLKDRVEELRAEDADHLIKKIATLERSEKGLKLKLDLIEAQEASFLETVDLSMLDSPQEILKQRIRDLEQMERHLRMQVGELEKDREELHELARKDKNVIHELNVQVRELQLKENNLRSQINKYDLEDSKMYSKLDDLTDENSELKEQLEKLQTRERSLNAQLQRAQYQETEWQMSLEHAKEDGKIAEGRMKKRQQELEQERKGLREKSDEHLERISELEAAESSLRQKIRNLENNDKQLKSRITELEQEGSNSGARTSQLEGLNEILSEKVHKLEEEKSSLVYDMSDLQFNKEEKEHENERLVSQLKGLKTRCEENEARKCAMQKRMDEFASKEIEMHAKLQDLERCDKEWRDRIEFLEHNEEKLRLRIRELEASVSTAENVKNLSGDYENEISQLKNIAEFHKQESVTLESDRNQLQRKLQLYEYAKANNEMSMIPASELTELRTQVALLEATERELERLEDQEACLKTAVEELRQGKDACGHDFELRELKEKADLYNKTVKANELLKEKYEETRQQLVSLQSQQKTVGVAVSGIQTSSKAVQVRLVEQYTLKHLSSEFKNALKNLGARHPQAYEDFVHLLQPTGKNVSHARVTSDPSVTLTKQLAGSLQSGSRRSHQAEKSRNQRRRGSRGRDETSREGEEMTSSERQLWKAVEGRRSQEVSDEETDHPHWTQVERNMSDTEEMTVTMHFDADQDETGMLKRARSTESVQSTGSLPPPPLPNMGPPSVRRSQSPGNESYYLPSADEASEIYDEDDLHPKRLGVSGALRAKSVDRDSDFSELTSHAPLTQDRKRAARSLDSIPDDSGYQEADSKILKERIAYLEQEVKNREEEVKELSGKVSAPGDSNKEAEINTLKTKLENKQRELETQQKVNRDTRVEMVTRDSEVQTLKLKLELLEKTNKSPRVAVDSSPIRVALKPVTASITSTAPPALTGRSDTSTADSQLDKKDRELRAKSNEVDRLVQELRKWQEDCRAAKEELSTARSDLDTSEGQLKLLKNIQDQYDEMLQRYNDLNQKYEELVLKQKPLEQASEDKQALEQVVTRLNSQLNDLEGIDLERKSLDTKVKALEKEVKQKTQTESDLCKENVELRHLVDSLQRDNVQYREMEDQYTQVTAQYKAMEEIKTKAQTMITPLRAKVLRLAQKCKTRNQLITRLVAELRKYEEGTQVLEEAETVQREEEGQDYSRPISPLTARGVEEIEKQIKSVNLPQPSSSKKVQGVRQPVTVTSPKDKSPRSSDPLKTASDSDTDDLLDPKLTNGLRKLRKNSVPTNSKRAGSGIQYSSQSILYNSRPIKVERHPDANANTLKLLNPPQISYKPVTLLTNSGSEQTHTESRPQNSVHTRQPGGLPSFGMLRAVKDYDPRKFSQSGHPNLELPLKTGDIVKQLGPVDEHGYIEADHEGRVGLVPSVYLTNTDTHRKLPTVPHDLDNNNIHQVNGSPEQILLMHEQLAASHIPQHAPSANVSMNTSSSSHGNHHVTSQEPVSTSPHSVNMRKPQRSHSLTLAHPAFALRKPAIQPALTQPHPPPPSIRSRPNSQPALLHPGSRNASPSLCMQNNNNGISSSSSNNNVLVTTAPQAAFMSLPSSLRNTPVQGHFTTPVQGQGHLTSTPGHSRPASTPLTGYQQQPAPPTRFRVQRIVGQDGVLLNWEPPTLDELGRSNGVTVKGYRITVDQKSSQHIPSPYMSKALLERLDLTQTHTFAIVTLGDASSPSSVPTQASFTEVLTPDHLRDLENKNLQETSLDSSLTNSSGAHTTGDRRVFMAVYDYNAKQLSPHKNSSEELSFKTGDVVVCYGKSREDGYYFGKVHGKKGLVPASFIEEVAVFGSKSKRSHSSGSHTLSPRYPPSSSSSQSVERTQRAS